MDSSMTSIFTYSYQANMERITKSAHQSPPETRGSDSRKTFEELLATNSEVLSNTNELSSLPKQNGSQTTAYVRTLQNYELLSNLSEAERKEAIGIQNPILATTAALQAAPIPGIYQSAEELTQSVKLLTPPNISVNELSGQPPKAPELISVKSVPDRAPVEAVPVKRAEIEAIIKSAGRYHGIDPTLSLAVAEVESSLRPTAVSTDGHASKGVFQLLDSTAKDMKVRLQVSEPYEPFNPSMNSNLGVGYLRWLHDIFSSETQLSGKLNTVPAKNSANLEKLALAAYNSGEGRVANAQRRAVALGDDPSEYSSVEKFLPRTTRAYVDKVLGLRAELDSRYSEDEFS